MPFSPKESRVKLGSVNSTVVRPTGCRERQSPGSLAPQVSFLRLPLGAGAMWLQQRPLGLADEESDDASCGSGQWGEGYKAISRLSHWVSTQKLGPINRHLYCD